MKRNELRSFSLSFFDETMPRIPDIFEIGATMTYAQLEALRVLSLRPKPNERIFRLSVTEGVLGLLVHVFSADAIAPANPKDLRHYMRTYRWDAAERGFLEVEHITSAGKN